MTRRRTAREYWDRGRQEIRNLALFLHAPKPGLDPAGGPPFPVAQTHTGVSPAGPWRRDPVHGKETGLQYFRLIPFLDFEKAGDHKIIWEPNRHQHLVRLAQRGDTAEVIRQLESWIDANPFQRGINWASALEVAFRSLSWIQIWQLTGAQFPAGFRESFLQNLYWHGLHLETNLSFYFSPNTHLLGEGLALHALGIFFPRFPRASRWRSVGGRVVREQMERQVRPDGAHFEQSTYYHAYALDMFAFHAMIEPPSAEYVAKLERMHKFLQAVLGPSGRLPLLGDDDGGCLFHPHSPRTVDVALQSKLFPDSGIAVLIQDEAHIVIDAGPFGPWSSGHSHADTLSLVVRIGNEDILIDPGTYTYMGPERNWFRGTAAHNTIRINGRDQAIPAGPFGWTDQPAVRILNPNLEALEAECAYGGFTHRRRFRLEAGKLRIEDEITGPPGNHTLEQFWHLGGRGARSRIVLDPDGDLSDAPTWASSTFGEKHPSPTLCLTRKGALPQRFTTEILL